MRHTADDFVDPYTYPGSAVLRNLLDEQNASRLDAAEYELTLYRRIELDEKPIKGAFDFARLRETHRRLFQDIYAWAGKTRTVEINRGGSDFHPSPYIGTAADQTFEWLETSGLLSPEVDDESFVRLSADLLEKLNYIHPFREGNGRTQRAFMDQIAELSGRRLAWRNVSPEDHLRASVNAFRDASGDPFRSVIRQVMGPPIDGLSPLDPQVYDVSAPLVSSLNAEDAEERQRAFYSRFPELRPDGSVGDKHPEEDLELD
jgi:cell filamentation protein